MKRVFHFSGGGSSAYMVLHYWQPGDLVIFCDTGREDQDTYRFVRDFETYNDIPIVWLYGDFRRDVIIKEQMIPNRYKRKCTINLKIKKARRYLRSIGWFTYIQFIGFRADEPYRVKTYNTKWKSVETIFPLYKDGVEKPEILLFWKGKEYGLKIPAILSNCDLCFQKGIPAITAILSVYPEKADKWIEDEESKIINPKGYTYFQNITFRTIRDNALVNKDINLTEIEPALTCACTA